MIITGGSDSPEPTIEDLQRENQLLWFATVIFFLLWIA